MAATPSTMTPLGTVAPDFTLPDPRGREVSLSDFGDRQALLVMFICNHCPFVKHIADELARLGREYGERGVGIVAINSNDVESHPEDHPDRMAEEVKDRGYTFPYLFDETQEVAQKYGASCTPDFFLFDGDHKLVYRGQLDESRPSLAAPVTGKDLRAALDAVLAGKPVPEAQTPSIGCNIKWRAGNEPEYA